MRLGSFRHLCRISPFLISLVTIAAAATNRTIDDQEGDSVTGAVPSYTPVGSWNQGSTCDGCFVHLDPSQTFDGTWHDSTHTPGDPEPRVITAQFTGTAVYVYNVLANYVEYTTTLTNITFTLDGNPAGSFVHIPTDSTSFQYDVPVFVKTGLANTSHTIVITAGGDTNSSLVLFDYIVYTFEDAAQSSIMTSSAAATTGISSSFSTATAPLSSSTVTMSTASAAKTSSFTATGSSTTVSSLLTGSGAASAETSGLGGQPLPSGGADGSTPSGTSHAVQDNASFPVGAVAGGVAGGVVAILVAAALLFFLCKRRHARRASPSAEEDEKMDRYGGGVQGSAYLHGGTGRAYARESMLGSNLFSTVPPMPQPSSGHSVADTTSMSSYGAALRLAPLRRVPTNDLRSPDPQFLDSASPASRATHSHIRSPASSISAGTAPAASETSSQSLLAASPACPAQTPPPPPPSAYPREKAGHVADHASISVLQIPERARSPGAASAATGVSTLRDQVAMLQEEIERLREQQELQRLLDGEAPPQYVEA